MIKNSFINGIVAKMCSINNNYTPDWKLQRGLTIGRNYISNEPYQGINAINTHAWLTNDLIIDGQIIPRSNYWITMKQASELGATLKSQFVGNDVKKRELKAKLEELIIKLYSTSPENRNVLKNKIKEIKNELSKYSCSQTIVKFKFTEVQETKRNAEGVWERVWKTVVDENGDEIQVPVMVEKCNAFYYTIFPIEAFDNLPELNNRNAFNNCHVSFDVDEEITSTFELYCQTQGIEVKTINSNPCYDQTRDVISIPNIAQFTNEGGYYSTLYNLAIQSTASERRLNRNSNNEELIGALGSLMVTAELGYYDTNAIENSLAYIKNHIDNIANSNDASFVFAAINAEKAKKFVLNQI